LASDQPGIRMTALFISDLHLDTTRPQNIHAFLRFLQVEARSATALYILGDLFEAWVGDDDDDPGWTPVMDALAALSASGTACHVMHGNRDFLIGERFAQRTGARLLPDHEVVNLWGQRVLLMHGDLLCTDDTTYMESRTTLRDPAWQQAFLARPLDERRAIAKAVRERSRTETAAKPEDIMDVNQKTVATTMREHDVHMLLHGHTHRPQVHHFELGGDAATRIVLGAWEDDAVIVRWDSDGFTPLTLDLTYRT
jgi:UDP-2,3-diacylglucosamine hydrolase